MASSIETAYSLEMFRAECSSMLQSGEPLTTVLPVMTARLARLLANPAFVAATFKPDDVFTKKLLCHDPATDFRVLAHVHQGPKEGPPHSHGASWAIYGTALGVTGMKEWRRINPPTEAASVLELADRYDLAVGQSRGYGPWQIHSTIHSGKAWVIRVTGTDLDVLPRYRFDKSRDQIVAPAE